MRRFKVKDLLISPVAMGNLQVTLLAGDCRPLTERQCAEGWTEHRCIDAETNDAKCKKDELTNNVPCNNDASTTPCAVNSDTTLDCAKGDVTYLPCLKQDKTVGQCSKDPKLPKQDKTRFRCYFDPKNKKDTAGVCKGGENTEVPGWPEGPWHGCKDAVSKVPCADDSNTKYECWKKAEPADKTKYECRDNSDTDQRCKGPTTAEACLVWTCAWGHTDFAGVEERCERTEEPMDCPPLSALYLPADHPLALDALEILRAELQAALGRVTTRRQAIESALRPQTVEEADVLERSLEALLKDVRTMKRQLEASGAAEGESPGGGTPRRKSKPRGK